MTENSHLVRIVHETLYTYQRPVTFMPHRLVLRPREGFDVRVEEFSLQIKPRCDVVWSRDIFGNSIAHVYFTEEADHLRIDSDVTIRRFEHAACQPMTSTAAVAYPVQYESLEQTMVSSYIKPIYPEETGALQEWIRSQELPESAGAEAILLHLTAAVYHRVRYQRREQKGVQSPETTLTLGHGSCRDMATLLMEAARHVGIATRFASGYLDCASTRAAQGVTHAWTEAYFPGLGWLGFDPTVGRRCTQQHVVLGVSNHPRGVMPVTGRYLGSAEEFREMTAVVRFVGR